MTPLQRAIRVYKGRVYIRRLLAPTEDSAPLSGMEEVQKSLCDDDLHQFILEAAPKAYTKDKSELVKSVYDGPGGLNSDNYDSYFCSKLVAHTYMKMGLLNERSDGPAGEYIPDDFSSRSNAIKLRNGYHLGEEFLVYEPWVRTITRVNDD